jgi:hypothetical protein
MTEEEEPGRRDIDWSITDEEGGTFTFAGPPHVPNFEWPDYKPCGRQRHGDTPVVFTDVSVDQRGKPYRRELRVCYACLMELLILKFQESGIHHEVKDSRDTK